MSMDEYFGKIKVLKKIVYTIDMVYTLEYNVNKLMHHINGKGVSRTQLHNYKR